MTKISLISLIMFAFPVNALTQNANDSTDLGNKNLARVPDNVFKKLNLTYLDLGSSFTMYPPLSALMDSSHNGIRELPDAIGRLTQLKTLILTGNRLRTLPDSIRMLKNLEVLDLSVNTELDVAEEIEKLKGLTNLKLLNIVMTGTEIDRFEFIRRSLPPSTRILFTFSDLLEHIRLNEQ